MNGVHDMGGMQGFGPVVPEKNEPVFHAAWEGRALAMVRVVGATGKLTALGSRPAIESIPAADYLRMSYYEKWYTALVMRLIASGLATPQEIDSGKPAKGSVKAVPALHAAEAAKLPFQTPPMLNPASARPARFSPGQHVRAKLINPAGHTRLPRYARGRVGTIERDRGAQAFPDTTASNGRASDPQSVYSVRFAARDLWGAVASARDAVYIDLWEDYLEPA